MFPLNPKITQEWTAGDWEKFARISALRGFKGFLQMLEERSRLHHPVLNWNKFQAYCEAIRLLVPLAQEKQIALCIQDADEQKDCHFIDIRLPQGRLEGKAKQIFCEAMSYFDMISFDGEKNQTFLVNFMMDEMWMEGKEKE